ncbi:MAG: hypothetical protein KKG47_08140 [Proteobacteria bacterium]|nr:hypothetical protein [Pseudomonadota bacterium]MBU1738269.1 hypothetical protein [Pseudomonadota bacterium]
MIEKILITVKTYPTLSKKYAELVCTAGVTENGEWRRLYPIRFRQLYDGQKYGKYQWVEAELERSSQDGRPESHKILPSSLNAIGPPLPTDNCWRARRESFLDKVVKYDDLQQLIELAHRNELSLAVFRPIRFLEFTFEPVEREWNAAKLADLEKQKQQLHLFSDEETVARQFEIVRKLPYKFSYRFEDCQGKTSKLMIEDWEIGALYWNCLKDNNGNEQTALEKVKEKYWDQFVESGRHELSLVLGTTLEHHNKRAPNPFVIISVVYPLFEKQMRMF